MAFAQLQYPFGLHLGCPDLWQQREPYERHRVRSLRVSPPAWPEGSQLAPSRLVPESSPFHLTLHLAGLYSPLARRP